MIPTIVTGTLVDDVHCMPMPLVISQAQNFLQGKSDPTAYFNILCTTLTDPSLQNTVWRSPAQRLLDTVSLRVISLVGCELGEAAAARKGGDAKASKPADLYRKYAANLRKITSVSPANSQLATEMVVDLFLEQTLSDGDLETPDYQDAYTGEKTMTYDQWVASIPDVHEPGIESLLRDLAAMPVEDEGDGFDGVAPVLPVNSWNHELCDMGRRMKKDLGWNDAQVSLFIGANAEFVGGDDEEPFDDDRGYVPPTLGEKELVIDRPTFYAAKAVVKAFHERRIAIFKNMKSLGVKSTEWYSYFRDVLVNLYEYKELIATIENIARNDITTAALVTLLVTNNAPLEDSVKDDMADKGYMLIPSDLQHIKGMFSEGSMINLLDYLADWQDDLLDLLGDAGISHKYLTSESDIIAYDKVYIEALTAKMPKYDVNPLNTASWNVAYIQAINTGATFEEADKSAWSAWRFEMSPKASSAYDTTYVKTGDRKQAMRSFWQIAPREVPRPQDIIEALQGNHTGLVLKGGRRIDWKIAALKAKQHELYLPDDIKARLTAKLADIPAAKEFIAAM